MRNARVWYAVLGFSCLLPLVSLASAQEGAPVNPAEPPGAQAQPDSAYEVALSEALAAHARGEYAQARIFMERAHELEPSARTLRGLGIVAFAQARHLDAIRYFDASLASSEKRLSPELVIGVKELLGHAWGQVGRYEIVIDPDTGDFLVDGQAPDFYAPSTVVLTPGPHLLTARAPSRAPYETSFEVKAGEQRALQLVLAVPPAPQIIEKHVVLASGPREREQPAPSTTFWSKKVRWTTLGVGSALVLSGVSLWALAYTRLNDVADACRNRADGTCTPRDAEKRYRGENIGGLAISAGLLTGAGAVALVTLGSVELWHARKQRAEKQVYLRVGFGELSAGGVF